MTTTEKEEWKHINGFTKYMISSHGRIKTVKTNKLRMRRYDKFGYLITLPYEITTKELQPKCTEIRNGLYIRLTNKTFRIEKLVAEYFLDNPDHKTEITYKDNNNTNCRVDNLVWCSTEKQ